MNPERWAQIKEIYGQASELLGGARARYLRDACGSDPELRREVESLLEERSGSDLRSPVQEANWVGREVAHFSILERIGAGGMGVVWKAEDTRLKRPVSLKFLATHLLGENEEKARFVREAQAAAALDHPNICTVYEIDEIDGQTFIAMAYIEGQSVNQKIAARPLKLDEALDIAIQTAQGLKAAHQKGIVHRDIKPANLMLTREGQVKIMDFGLAQFAAQSRLTKTGTTLGTVAYMSPEQAKRLPTDHRTDIWSLGVVLYEMATGRRPFDGEREEPVLHAIANEEPEPITALRAGVPLELEWIVGKALAKDREERYQHVEELIVDLRGLGKKLASGKSTIVQTGAEPALARPRARERETRLAWMIAALCFAGMLALALLSFRQTPSNPTQASVRKFVFTPPVALQKMDNALSPVDLYGIAVSPDGKQIVFTARNDRRLWIHELARGTSRPLEGTEGASFAFWAPRSDFIGYTAGTQIKIIPARGGMPIPVHQRPGSTTHRPGWNGAAWSPDGSSIVFSQDGKLYGVPARGRGGAPELIVSPEELEQSLGGLSKGPMGFLGQPHFLPPEAGARTLVYTFGFGAPTQRTMMVHDLQSGRREVLGPGESPFYSMSGHLLYQAGPMFSDLWALPFSLETLQGTGQAFPIVRNSRVPTVASDQTLVYLAAGSDSATLVWIGRGGERLGVVGQPTASILYPRISPDGRRAVISAVESGNRDLFVYDLTRYTKSRFTSDPTPDLVPAWTHSGRGITFTSLRRSRDIFWGNRDIFWKSTDGAGEARPLLDTAFDEVDHDWSSDGRFLVYNIVAPDTVHDIWYAKRKADGALGEPRKFLATEFRETIGALSPNGRFLAYTSNQSGQFEVYVRTFPEGRGGGPVSVNGGTQPRWSRDGKELFYVKDETLFSVPVETEGDFEAGTPVRLFDHPGLLWGGSNAQYDVSADGRFLMKEYVESAAPRSIHVVQNWYEEFRDREQE